MQAIVAGRMMRKNLKRRKQGTLTIQKIFRGYRARKWFEEEMHRKTDGPRVTQVYKRAAKVSGYTIVLTVYKCGESYKFIGENLQLLESYKVKNMAKTRHVTDY